MSLFRRIFTDPVIVTETSPVAVQRSSDWVYRNLFQSRFSAKKVFILFFLPLVLLFEIITVKESDTDDEDTNLGAAAIVKPNTDGAEEQSTGVNQPVDRPTTRRPHLRTWTDTVAMFNGVEGEDDYVGRFHVFVIACTIFGALHFLAWPAEMPTSSELIMWRFAAIYLTAFPVFAVLTSLLSDTTDMENNSFWDNVMWTPTTLGAILHPILRAIIVIDALALLRQLPDTAYRDLSWSDVIPSL